MTKSRAGRSEHNGKNLVGETDQKGHGIVLAREIGVQKKGKTTRHISSPDERRRKLDSIKLLVREAPRNLQCLSY